MELRKPERLLTDLDDLRFDQRRALRKQMQLKAQGEDTQIYQIFTRVQQTINADHLKFIRDSLSNHFIFCSLLANQAAAQKLGNTFFTCQAQSGQLIIKEGDKASAFFLLVKGRVEILVGGVVKKQINQGEGFGDLALLYNAPRSASCRAAQKCIMFGIDRHTFRQTIEQINNLHYSENRSFLDQVNFFQNLPGELKDSIANLFILEHYMPGQVVVNEGQLASSFYIIKKGVLKAYLKQKEMGKLKQGESFGENALLSSGQIRQMSVKVQTEADLLSLGRQSLQNLLGRDLQVIIFRNKIKVGLMKSQVFNKLSTLNHEKIIDSLQIRKAPVGTVLCKPGQSCRQNIFIILQGQCTNNSKKYDYRGIFHGQDSVKIEKADSKYNNQIKMTKTGTVAQIDFKTLCQQLKDSYQSASEKFKLADLAYLSFSQNLVQKRERAKQISLDRWVCIKKLGQGNFGCVFLVSAEGEQEMYALKCISKAHIIQSNLQKHIEQEKKVMETIYNPFVMQYIRSYRDDSYVYFLLEYIHGIQLFQAIRHIGLLQPHQCKFYVASILLALQYLHSLHIVYRDLKPQNIMVDDKGYLSLIDMGTCKLIKSKGVPKTYTIIGTPHYMAPQVLSGQGYAYMADIWSVGICLFQFLMGYVPYGQNLTDPFQIFQEIVSQEIQFKDMPDKQLQTIIRQFLCKTPETRLPGGYLALKSHPWFIDFEWDELNALRMKAPFVPLESQRISGEQMRRGKQLREGVKVHLRSVDVKGAMSQRKDICPDWDSLY